MQLFTSSHAFPPPALPGQAPQAQAPTPPPDEQQTYEARLHVAHAHASSAAAEDNKRACQPGVNVPFADLDDAIARLLPYHVFSAHDEDETDLGTVPAVFAPVEKDDKAAPEAEKKKDASEPEPAATEPAAKAVETDVKPDPTPEKAEGAETKAEGAGAKAGGGGGFERRSPGDEGGFADAIPRAGVGRVLRRFRPHVPGRARVQTTTSGSVRRRDGTGIRDGDGDGDGDGRVCPAERSGGCAEPRGGVPGGGEGMRGVETTRRVGSRRASASIGGAEARRG